MIPNRYQRALAGLLLLIQSSCLSPPLLGSPDLIQAGARQAGGFQIQNQGAQAAVRKTLLKLSVAPPNFIGGAGQPTSVTVRKTFSVAPEDLSRKLLLNLTRLSDSVRSHPAQIKLNGQLLYDSQDGKLTARDISLPVAGLQAGDNTLEVTVPAEPSTTMDIELLGFLEPLAAPGAIHSRIPDYEYVKDLDFEPGVVCLKFSEGLKVRLQDQPNGQPRLVELEGVSLTLLEEQLKQYGVKRIDRAYGLPPEEVDEEERQAEEVFQADVPNMNLFYYLHFDAGTDAWQIVKELRKLPFVEEAFPRFIPEAPFVPNDPELSGRMPSQSVDKSQWLKNTRIMDDGPDKPGAWAITRGKGAKVAVIDRAAMHAALNTPRNLGIVTHEDLNGPNVQPISNVDVWKLPLPFTNMGHGTEAAGVIGAVGNNGKGTAGVAYEAVTMPIQAFSDDGAPSACRGTGTLYCEPTIDALILSQVRGAQVTIIEIWYPPGFGGQSGTAEMARPDIRAAIASAVARGHSVIVPAGNNGNQDIRYLTINGQREPMPDTGSIIVGGVVLDGSAIDPGYNYGKSLPNGQWTLGGHGTDVSAPSQWVVWTVNYPEQRDPGNYANFAGTSAASPIVAGIVGLMLSARPGITTTTPREIRRILRETARQNLPNIAGMVNAYEAVRRYAGLPAPTGLQSGLIAKYFANTIYLPVESRLGLSGEEALLPDGVKIVPQIDFWGSEQQRNGDQFGIGQSDFLSAEFQGKLYVPRTGQHGFWVGHDDGAVLQIDGQTVVNANYPTGYRYDYGYKYLTAGYHDIRLSFSELSGAAAVSLWWQPPGGNMEVVPASVLFHDSQAVPSARTAKSPRLAGRFFDGLANPPWPPLSPFKSKFFDLLNFVGANALQLNNLGDTFGIGKSDRFAGFFSGYLRLPAGYPAGQYRLIVGHDDGAILYVNGERLIDDAVNRNYVESYASKSLTLSPGVNYSLVLTYHEDSFEAELGLYWQTPHKGRETIPASALWH